MGYEMLNILANMLRDRYRLCSNTCSDVRAMVTEHTASDDQRQQNAV